MINVMLVDDHRLIREGITQLLEFCKEFEIVCEASNGEECLSLLEKHKVDIILLDINMPVLNGIDTLREIRKRGYDVKVLMLTVHDEVEYLEKAIDIGLEGYILKDSGLEELKRAIHSILEGDIFIEPKLSLELNNHSIKKNVDKEKIDTLTKREMEVLKLVAKGEFNKDIALTLDISERTVKNHIFNIFKKLGVSDRTQAAVFAIRNDLISI